MSKKENIPNSEWVECLKKCLDLVPEPPFKENHVIVSQSAKEAILDMGEVNEKMGQIYELGKWNTDDD